MILNYIKQPKKIEATSFEIIEKELGNKALEFDERTLKVVKRVIHTTADFEYADLIKFHPNAIESAIQVLKKGSRIYADTKMIMVGTNSRRLSELNCDIYNLSHEKEVFEEAEKRGITRSMVGMEKAFHDQETQIFVIGNAPTALFTLKELIEKTNKKPELIIGVPVGFVGAEESKEILLDLDVPYITVTGRKGGSTVAVAILNALMYMI